MEIISKYPILFHKYLLKIADPEEDLCYTSSYKFGDYKRYILHIHIYDLSKFHSFFGNFIHEFYEDYTIIITYSIGNPLEKPELDIVYIKVKNKGYDIGGKICALDYLYKLDVKYEYILFLHSKSDKKKRAAYFNPFIVHRKELKDMMAEEGVMGIFPNTLWIDHNGFKNYGGYDVFKNNEKYLDELFGFLGIERREKIFAEGNCMILKKDVIDFIFSTRCKLFYNLLNEENSFDYNWFIHYYKKAWMNPSISSSYNEYMNRNLFGNNNGVKNTSSSHPDSMIEHVFERLWINAILQLGKTFKII